MSMHFVEANVFSCNAAISACAGRWLEALELLRKAVAWHSDFKAFKITENLFINSFKEVI